MKTSEIFFKYFEIEEYENSILIQVSNLKDQKIKHKVKLVLLAKIADMINRYTEDLKDIQITIEKLD